LLLSGETEVVSAGEVVPLVTPEAEPAGDMVPAVEDGRAGAAPLLLQLLLQLLLLLLLLEVLVLLPVTLSLPLVHLSLSLPLPLPLPQLLLLLLLLPPRPARDAMAIEG